jgi:hypothetical protein
MLLKIKDLGHRSVRCRAVQAAGMAAARWSGYERLSGNVHAVGGAEWVWLKKSIGVYSCDRRLVRVCQWINYRQDFVSAKIVLLIDTSRLRVSRNPAQSSVGANSKMKILYICHAYTDTWHPIPMSWKGC